MENFFKYFPTSEKDELWGLTVMDAGCTSIAPNTNYPPSKHPASYTFHSEKGRVLQEYQIIYISRGSGIFQSSQCNQEIREGSVILLHPGQEHQYFPCSKTGWNEHWVGFKGPFIDNLITKSYFDASNAVTQIGYNETVLQLFNHIIKTCKQEGPGYQPVISGAVIYLLGLVYAEQLQHAMPERDTVEAIVSKARIIFREKIAEDISPEQVAAELNVGYSWFRKVFKKYTGLAPGQYLIQLKIQRAKELLAKPDKLIKEIAFELNINSPLHLSNLFKSQVGLTPQQYRRLVLKK